jgi:uncharacterized protein (TIGR03083 family)
MTEAHAVAYAELRERVTALVADLAPAELECPAPATPGWRVRDVLAHMVGVTDDIVNGRFDGIASDAWTAAQVDPRRAVPITDLLGDWAHYGPQFVKLLGDAPAEIAGQALFDSMTHEQDLRHAVARPGARAGDAMALSWSWIVDTRTSAGATAIRLVSEHDDDIAGTGEPRATVRATRYELLRAMTGRRSHDEIAAYEWEPAPDLELLLAAPFFTIRTTSLGE